MITSKDMAIEKKQKAQWHFQHCEIETENDPDSGTTAWCIEHLVDVTDMLPDFDPEPDMYDNSEENLNAN